ncbi:EamA family transporter RarD [Reinekea sp.]|jgi:chloramphenicol-sensitive protein RarD|uniref:EamA family transporter RarD n=1 Tax=Reinekea sp. TaxID=1970455 RepID=UPI002A83E61E|nr:EamA family transporter RarD [Reinekea sp.]
MEQQQRQGYLFALAAFGLWAVTPVYFKWVGNLPALDILAYRIVWSLVLTLIIIGLSQRWRPLWSALTNRNIRLSLLASTLLIGTNWGIFIWAINDDQMLSASLGYYINPLVNILLGMVFFAERLDRIKKVAASLCLIAVVFEVLRFGQLPWVALLLPISFGLYGLVRKKLAVDSFVGMALETGLLLPVALLYLIFSTSPSADFFDNDLITNGKLLLAGPATMIPLLCFAAAANRMPLSSIAFFQYIGPSGMFLLAVFVYNEPLEPAKLVTFGIIWSALALLVWDGVNKLRLKRHSTVVLTPNERSP